MWILALFIALLHVYTCHGAPKYTWPLDIVNPLLETRANVTEGQPGCSYQQGLLYDTLNYNGIYMSGSSYSYIDVTIGNAHSIDDFAITIYVKRQSLYGVGTIFHYRVDAAAVDNTIIQIKDVILSNNETHLIAETFGPYDELYGFTAAALDAATLAQNWTGICVSHDGKKKTRIITNTGIDILTEAAMDAEIEQPAMLRFGSSFYPERPPFFGNIICANMYGTKDCHLDDSLVECTGGAWQLPIVPVTETCTELKGYFKIKQQNAVIDNSVSPINTTTTSSRMKCAELCVRTEICWTYTLNKVTVECKIYDSDYSVYLVPATGSNYYIRRDICCSK
ncbi:uncharacterized protein LOC132756171 [Ruditapes philippinarum]|uniref:uncharacterized protein LOC132756171 n=1 Tax=Ruditapes philippinarum TaxID=129788 RepID=UPI00295A9524|nr:uncharacterized protein LOC132756171 [Ruditapes philippinarum]